MLLLFVRFVVEYTYYCISTMRWLSYFGDGNDDKNINYILIYYSRATDRYRRHLSSHWPLDCVIRVRQTNGARDILAELECRVLSLERRVLSLGRSTSGHTWLAYLKMVKCNQIKERRKKALCRRHRSCHSEPLPVVYKPWVPSTAVTRIWYWKLKFFRYLYKLYVVA